MGIPYVIYLYFFCLLYSSLLLDTLSFHPEEFGWTEKYTGRVSWGVEVCTSDRCWLGQQRVWGDVVTAQHSIFLLADEAAMGSNLCHLSHHIWTGEQGSLLKSTSLNSLDSKVSSNDRANDEWLLTVKHWWNEWQTPLWNHHCSQQF